MFQPIVVVRPAKRESFLWYPWTKRQSQLAACCDCRRRCYTH